MPYSFDNIIKQFSQSLGVSDMEFDETGYCTLLINDADTLMIRRDDVANAIVLAAIVAHELPEPISYDLVTEMLEFALAPMAHAGPGVGLDRDGGGLIAYVSLPIATLGDGDLAIAVTRFLDFRHMMAARLAQDSADMARRPTPLSGDAPLMKV